MAYNTTLVRRLITNLSRRNIVRVEFVKRDGTNRTMYCVFGDKGKVDRSVVTVFDIDKMEYRNIPKARLLSVI